MFAIKTLRTARRANAQAGGHIHSQVHHLRQEIRSGLDEAVAARALMRNFKLTARRAVELLGGATTAEQIAARAVTPHTPAPGDELVARLGLGETASAAGPETTPTTARRHR